MDTELVNKRLLLAKEFYHHAVEHSLHTDAINKMMAIHNFHIAVEITLRAILLKYQIRSDKTLNIDFETMLSDIDKNIDKKITEKKLMFRQEIRSLNQLRGLVQHQGIEPDKTSMEHFRVITKLFLENTYKVYFNLSFNDLSRITLISDNTLKELLIISQQFVEKGDGLNAAVRLIAAFKFASHSITKFLPNEGLKSSRLFHSKHCRSSRHSGLDADIINCLEDLFENYFEDYFKDTFSRINKVEEFTAIISSGVSLSSLKRLESIPISLEFSITGCPLIQIGSEVTIDNEEVVWAIDFVISCILLWQQQGLAPKIENESIIKAANNLLNYDNL